MRFRFFAALAGAVSMSLATMACSANAAAGTGSASGRGRAAHPVAVTPLTGGSVRLASWPWSVRVRRPAHAPVALDRPFGTGCGEVPRIGGVRTPPRLAMVPVVTAMAKVPALSELVHAISLAGLTKQLDTAPALTVFAPDNGAFGAFGISNLQALYSTRPDLIRALKFQIVAGRVQPAELARQRALITLGGTKIYPAKAPPSYYVNNAWVSCGNLRTANATVYVVNRLVVPAG